MTGINTLEVEHGDASDDSSQQRQAVNPCRQPSWEEWEAQRQRITELYRDKDFKLKRVMQILEEESEFYASARMYKTRIKTWKIGKRAAAVSQELSKRKRDSEGTQRHSSTSTESEDSTNKKIKSSHPSTSNLDVPAILSDDSGNGNCTTDSDDAGAHDFDLEIHPETNNGRSQLKTTVPSRCSPLATSAKSLGKLPREHLQFLPPGLQGLSPPSHPTHDKHHTNRSLLTLIKLDNMDGASNSTALSGQVDAVASRFCLPQYEEEINYEKDIEIWRRLTPSPGAVSSSTGAETSIQNTPSTGGSERSVEASLTGLSPLISTALLAFEDQQSVLPNRSLREERTPRETKSCRWISLCFQACIMKAEQDESTAELRIAEASGTFAWMISCEDPMLLMAPILLLSVLQCHGQTDLATTFTSSAFERARAALGEGNPTVLILSYVAAAAAAKIDECTVDSPKLCAIKNEFECSLGQEHPSTLAALYMTGFSLIRSKNYTEATQHLHELLVSSEKVLGSDHILTVVALNALARVQSYMDQPDAAERTWVDSLQRSRRLLGEFHPQRLETKRRLAMHYESMGKFDLAERNFKEVLFGRARTLGVHHQFTTSSFNALGEFLEKQGRSAEIPRLREILHEAANSGGLEARYLEAY